MSITLDTEEAKAHLRSGPEPFNAWRVDKPSAHVDLGNVNMLEVFADETNLYAGRRHGRIQVLWGAFEHGLLPQHVRRQRRRRRSHAHVFETSALPAS